jgi:hypothetical protein
MRHLHTKHTNCIETRLCQAPTGSNRRHLHTNQSVQKEGDGKCASAIPSRTTNPGSISAHAPMRLVGSARCAFPAEIYARGCHWIPPMFA